MVYEPCGLAGLAAPIKRQNFEKKRHGSNEPCLFFQADDGNRTRDLRLTKATLYRLSHISDPC